MKTDAAEIAEASLRHVMPSAAVKNALSKITFQAGRLLVIAVGKAAYEMAEAASDELGERIDEGTVITKYNHSKGPLPRFTVYEAGHPVPDENGYSATAKVLEAVKGLVPEDNVLFLLSGGGSALFEQPLIPQEEMEDITRQLLALGADIVEMNTCRKRLSGVKGGRFALCCRPAHVFSIVLSDIIGDPLDMIASGPAYPDSSTSEQALSVVRKYNLKLSEKALTLLKQETPKALDNVTTFVTGSVKELCAAAAEECRKLGYEPFLLTTCLACEAREAGAFLGAIAKEHAVDKKPIAFLSGGETVVHLTGSGKGGRNQELALAAAKEIAGLNNVCVFSFGSDGTDGPTDAAGGIVDGYTQEKLEATGYSIDAVLKNNDAYHALKAVNGLIFTGPTGTNVNDLSVVLIKP